MMKINKNIVIAGLARDCSINLQKNIPRIEELRNQFSWSHVVVVENDSLDDTKLVLDNWKNTSKGVTIISENFGSLTIPEKSAEITSPGTSYYRIDKMSFYRNIYMNFIDSIEEKIDYLIIIDLDIEFFSVNGVLNSIIKSPKNFGGIFANGVTTNNFLGINLKLYFDIFAVYEYPLKSSFSYTFDSLEKTFKTINYNVKKHDFYSVISAFSGIAIYKFNAVRNLKYKAIKNGVNTNDAVCEHIFLNEQLIRSGYKNYISRDLLVKYGNHNLGLDLKYILPQKVFHLFYKILYIKLKNWVIKISQTNIFS